MNDRLIRFLNAENISQASFAETIGVAKASVSHVLSGRNKPGYDFIEGIALHFPALNMDWLLTGKGRMYKNSVPETSLFPEDKDTDTLDNVQQQTIVEEIKSDNTTPERKIAKLVVFYSDNTFEEIL